MTSIIYTFPWYARAINWIVKGKEAEGKGAGGRGVKGRGGAFCFKWSFMVLNIFVIIFCVYNGRTGGILR